MEGVLADSPNPAVQRRQILFRRPLGVTETGLVRARAGFHSIYGAHVGAAVRHLPGVPQGSIACSYAQTPTCVGRPRSKAWRPLNPDAVLGRALLEPGDHCFGTSDNGDDT